MTVEDLNRYRMQRTGDSMFLGCSCGGMTFHAVCVASQSVPVISALVCADCGAERPVTYGQVEV